MLDGLIRFSIRNKLVIGIFTVALIIWGSYSVTQLPIDAVPDITNNQVQIITVAPSQSAQEIERLVTFPVEQAVATVPGIEEVRSFSRFGLSVVTVVFHDDIDVYTARQQVAERLSLIAAEIPPGVGQPEMAPVTTGLGEIYQYTLHAKPGYEDQYDAMALRTIQDWIVRRQLLGVEGVADVSSFGGLLKQYEIALNPDKLKSMNITITEVFDALEANNQNTGGAYIDKEPYTWYIRSEGLIEDTNDIKSIVVKSLDDGTPVLIRNIADVRFGHAIRYGALTYNNKGEAVGAIVMMLKGANSSEVIGNVKERIAQIEKTLPEGVAIEPFLDRSKLVDNAISTVTKNLLEGALIVIFILVLFLGNLRAGLIVASVIPLAMLFAISLMNVFGVSGNLMSLGAIDFGLIVDGAVIIVEATMHHLGLRRGMRLTQSEMDLEVQTSASKIRNSAAFGEIIILIVYLPILALVGIEGKMFKPMAQTVSFAILGAFILSLTYVPMMSALFLSKKISDKKTISDRMMDFFNRMYTPAIKSALKRPLTITVVAVLLFVLSLWTFTRLGAEFLPSLDEGDFAVETRVMEGSNLQQTVNAANQGAGILLERFPDEVEMVVGKIGAGEIPTDPMPINACDMMVILREKSQWTKTNNKDELAELMAEELEDIPGVSFGFQQPIQMRFNELMTGARQDVVVKVYGENLDTLSEYAEQIAGIVAGVEGATDLYQEKVTGGRQILIDYKREDIARFGLSIADINRTINMAFAGQATGQVYEGERRFDLVVRLAGSERQSIEDVRNLYISTPAGVQIPLSQVADVAFDDNAPLQIQRDDAKRRITIGFNVRGRDVESVVEELQVKIDSLVNFSAGYFPTYGGTFENLQAARTRLAIAVPVALILIFLLLYFTFGSVKQGLLIYSAIPLSAIGGVYALWLRDMPFSISAGVGFIALFGVAVLNGIVLIAEFNRLKKDGVTDVVERIMEGTKTRLRPVIMTAAVASLGFLPMAVSGGSGAEVQKPLATVVIGGLVSATLLTLLVLPVIYLLSEGGFKIRRKPKPMKPAAGMIVLFMLIAGAAFAQGKEVSLDSALSIAYRNNKNLQATAMETDYYGYRKKSASELPKTEALLTYGQYNSFYRQDNNITVTQAIPFPGVFVARNSLAEAQQQGSVYRTASTKNELTYMIRDVYYQLLYWQQHHNLLLTQDTLYSNLARAADLKLKAGEGTLLDKTSAEARAADAKNRLLQANAQMAALSAQLQMLMGVDYAVAIAPSDSLVRNLNVQMDSTAIASNPQLAYLKQQIEVAEQEKKLQNQEALPEFKIGYFNQTLYGTPLDLSGAPLATSANRFTGVQVGVAVPLWFVPNVNNSKAAQVQADIARLEYENEQLMLNAQYNRAVQRYIAAKNNLSYFSSTALPAATLIESQSVMSYGKGEISYTQHLMNMQQVASVRENYLLAQAENNQAVIALEYLTAQ